MTSDLDTNGYFYGAQKSWIIDDYSTYFQKFSDNSRHIMSAFGQQHVQFSGINFAERITISVSPKGFIVNGVLKTATNVEAFETPSSCILYAVGVNNRVLHKIKARIYSFSIRRNGVLQLNFIPALDDTGAPCMYDTVSHTAFYNQGASEEEGGKDFLYKLSVPETKQLPYGYYPLSYLESTGKQWIDTGIKLSNESEVKCEYEYDVEDPKGLFGCRYEYQHPQNYLYWGGARQPNVGLFFMGTALNRGVPVSRKERIKVITNASGCYVNGVFDKLDSGVVGEFETTESAPLFCLKWLSGGNIINHNFLGRVYAFSISRNGQLQLNLQPCLDDKGVPCMYDFVSGKSFYNKDTGSNFLYEIPAEIAMLPATMALREEKAEYGILTKNGLRRLYHPAKKLYFLPAQLTAYALENGYKPIIENEKPTDGNWAPVWTETEDEIILTWEEINEDEYTENW